MKIKLFLFKKLIKQKQELVLSNLYLYLFIEKLFFILSDLLYFYTICKLYKLAFIEFEKKNFKFFFVNYYILYLNVNDFCLNKNEIFLLCEYSKKVRNMFYLSKKVLINNIIKKFIFFKIILFYFNKIFISLHQILFFISISKFVSKNIWIYYLKNFTGIFKFLL